MFGIASVLTISAIPVPFTGGLSLFVVGYGLLLVGCVSVGVGLAVWRKVRGS